MSADNTTSETSGTPADPADDSPADSSATGAGDNLSAWGAFSPPPDFADLPEFDGEAPRPLPEFTRHCYYVRDRQATVWICAMIGSACWATKSLPFIETLSWYFLPLGYLKWVSYGIAALAAYYWIRNATTYGLLDYIRLGAPLTGRVRQVTIGFEGVKEAPMARFVAEVEFVHPVSGEFQALLLPAPDPFPQKDLPKMDSGLVSGEYVTLVYLPGRFDKSVRVYGWLGLNPDLDLIRKNGLPLAPRSPLTALLAVVGFTALMWAIMAFVYVFGRYSALDLQSWRTYAVGIGLACIPFVVVMVWRVDRTNGTMGTVLKNYLFVVFAALFCGFIVGYPAVGFINGYFDVSPPQLEPVRIVQSWQVTHKLMFREYELEYHPFPAGKTEKKMVTVETLALFEPNSLAVIDIGSGRLGMRWLRDFHPIVWNTVTDASREELPGEITFQLPDEPQPIRIAPQVALSETTFLPPPVILLPELRTRMLPHVMNNLQAKVIEGKKP